MPRTITQTVSPSARPERLWAMYVSADEHAACTGFPVTIAPRAGAEFRAFNGAIWGSMLDVVPNRLVVQRWRSKNFPPEALDSTLVLSFWPEGTGGRIELVHANVAEEDFPGVSEGWAKFYWNPWRAYLERVG